MAFNGVGGERQQEFVLDVAGLAPRGEDVDQRDVALAQVGVGEARPAVEAGQIERRRGLADQRRGHARGVAGAEPHNSSVASASEHDQRQQREPEAPAPARGRRRALRSSSAFSAARGLERAQAALSAR